MQTHAVHVRKNEHMRNIEHSCKFPQNELTMFFLVPGTGVM